MQSFNNVVHLIGRYPELRNNSDFVRWMRTHAAQSWHEQAGDNTITVVVQSTDGLSLFAAECDKRDKEDASIKIHRVADINLLQTEMLRDRALLEFKRETKITDANRIHAIRPVVRFTNEGDAEVEWEIETAPKGDEKARYRVSQVGVAKSFEGISSEGEGKRTPQGNDVVPPAADDLASNELHHPVNLASDARTAIGSATSIEGKARGIFNYVRRNYLYDSNILHISEFTWSDLLVRDSNGRKGICDEWAVVQISMLRAVGIPARLKFLIWQQDGNPVGHACLEYRDGNLWWHMDALWNAFHNPQIYRNSGGTNVTVMDADYPIDSRSTVPAWGVPDSTGDGKLYPYGDFTIIPSYPGNARSGYSY